MLVDTGQTAQRSSRAGAPPMPWKRFSFSLLLTSALLASSAVHAAEPERVDQALERGRRLRISGGVMMGLGAVLSLPMALAVVKYDSGSSELWRYVEIAEAAPRKFTPDEYAFLTDQDAENRRMRALAITTGVSSGLLFVGGLTTFILGTRYADERRPHVRAAPSFSPLHAGIVVRGRF